MKIILDGIYINPSYIHSVELKNHLKKPEVMERLTHWQKKDCPSGYRHKSELLKKMENLIKARIQKEITEWEKENKYFHNAYKEVLDNAKEKYCIIVNNMFEIRLQGHGDAQAAQEAVQRLLEPVMSELEIPIASKVILGILSPLFLVLIVLIVVISIPIGIGLAFYEYFGGESLQKNIETQMKKMTKAIIEKMIGTNLINKELKPVELQLIEAIRKIAAMIQEQLQSEKALIHHQRAYHLLEQLAVALDVQQKMQIQSTLLGQTKLMYLTYIKDYDIPRAEITLLKKIGEGGFGDVYEGKWKEQTVAVKVMKTRLTTSNVAEIQREETNLR